MLWADKKFRLGRTSKNHEKKRQASKTYAVGRPPKMGKATVTLSSQCLTESSLSEAVNKLILPQQWSSQPTTGNVAQVCKVSLTKTHGSVVTHSVTVYNDYRIARRLFLKGIYFWIFRLAYSVQKFIQPKFIYNKAHN